GQWTQRTALSGPVNTTGIEQSPLISPDGLELTVWARRDSSGDQWWQYRRPTQNGAFSEGVVLSLADARTEKGSAECYSPDGRLLLMRSNTFSGPRHVIFTRNESGNSWKKAIRASVLPDDAWQVRYAFNAGLLIYEQGDHLWQRRLLKREERPASIRTEVERPTLEFSSVPRPDSPDIVFADFEDGTYGRWTVEGPAFGNRPRHTLSTQHRDDRQSFHPWPINGDFAADSLYAANGYAAADLTGSLKSPPFQINRYYITFLAAGRADYVQLVIDGKVVLRGVSPPQASTETMRPIHFDVRRFLGRTATIEIVDDGKAPQNHVAVDHFVFSDSDRRGEWNALSIEQTKSQAIDILGRKYYFGPVPLTYTAAQHLAKSLGGRILTVESQEEATSLVPHLRGYSWQGVTKKGGVWQNEDGDIYTHADWGGHDHQGLIGESETHAHLTPEGEYRAVWNTNRFPVIEFGEPQKPPTYQLTAPEENRKLAETLHAAKAVLILATQDRYHYDWNVEKPLPDEPFEVRYVVLPKGLVVTEDIAKLFDFDNKIRHLTVNDGDDNSLLLIEHLNELRSLEIYRGNYQHWRGLRPMKRGHPLRRFRLQDVAISPQQIAPLFRAAALRYVDFVSVGLNPEIGEMLADHRESLVAISLNNSRGLGPAGYSHLRQLKRVRNAILWAGELGDGELRFIGQMQSLQDIQLGLNPNITGRTLKDLSGLQRLVSLSLWDTGISEETLVNLPPLPSLRSLELGRTSVSGASLMHLSSLPTLEYVGVSESPVTDAGIQQLLNCSNLQKIHAANSQVTRAALEHFFQKFPGFSTDVK
ncbi:MAG: hypothetical protein KDA96_15390, partial [Planctomycetaceae bacterium]|nr:hypothetical protein [Planctomycetaceae bacterium]